MAQVGIRCCLGEEIRTPVYSGIPLCTEVISLPLLVLFTISLAPGRSRGIREQKSLLSWKISSSSQKNWDFFFLKPVKWWKISVAAFQAIFRLPNLFIYTTNEEKLWLSILDNPLLLQLHFSNAVVGLFYLSLCGISPVEEERDLSSHCDFPCVF